MKCMSRALAVLAAAIVVIGFWLAIAALSGSTGMIGNEISRHGIEGGFNLASIVQSLSTLAAVAIAMAKVLLITLSLWFLSLQMIGRTKLFDRLLTVGNHS